MKKSKYFHLKSKVIACEQWSKMKELLMNLLSLKKMIRKKAKKANENKKICKKYSQLSKKGSPQI